LRAIELELLPDALGVARLEPHAPVPHWAAGVEGFCSITRTDAELSVVCGEASIPAEVKAQRGFSCLRVAGPLDFSEVGILAALTTVLARAGISVFTVSTYDTDYLLLPRERVEDAIAALSSGDETGKRVRVTRPEGG
jgi:hypothetical protein